MKTRIWTYILVFCSAFISAQGVDSVSAILIKYDVHLDIKESLAQLQGPSSLEEFYYIFKEDIVFIKEVHREGDGEGLFRCFDTSNRLVYQCRLGDKEIIVNSQSFYPSQDLFNQYDFGTVLRHRYADSVQVIEGYPCKPVDVQIGGIAHEVWYTDVFGTQFSTIADIPGIPLYYERTNSVDGKLKFRAVDVKPISVPAYYFDLFNYNLNSGENSTGKKIYTKPKQYEPISNKLMDGSRISTGDSLGRVMFFTFWRPGSDDLRPDMNTLNALQQEFKDDDMLFLAINSLSKKRASQSVPYSGFTFPHIANAEYLFSQYRIGSEPTHIIVDKRGYLRFRYSGVFGKPLYESMKSDIESLLPSRSRKNQ